MKILIISKRPTHPTDSGSRRFIVNQIGLFKSLGHDVYYLYIHENWSLKGKGDKSYKKLMQDYWGEKLFTFNIPWIIMLLFRIKRIKWLLFNNGYQSADGLYPPLLSRRIVKLQQKYSFDCCIINYYELSRVFVDVKFPLEGITTHDYFSYKSILVGIKNISLNTNAHEEAKALQRCPNIFALNSEEAIFFQKLSPKSTIYNVYSIYKYCESKIVGNHDLLFLSGNNLFNIHGIEWFIQTAFPRIIKKYPDAKLRIAGSICNVLNNNYLNNENIILEGYVKDEDEFYKTADVAINPTFEGTGLKIKTFEAISHDKVTLVHPHSLCGIYKSETAPVYSSSKPEDWVAFLDKIWSSEQEMLKIKESNKSYIESMNRFVQEEYLRFFNNINR